MLQISPSARQLATRLKPLPSFTRDTLKACSNLHKRERLKTTSNGDDNDYDDDSDDMKRSRVDRLRSKAVKIPPSPLHHWKRQIMGGVVPVSGSAAFFNSYEVSIDQNVALTSHLPLQLPYRTLS